MNRSMTDRIEARPHLNGQFTSTQTPSAGVDTKGLRTAEIMAYVGTVSNIQGSPGPGWTLALQDSDSASANFAACDDIDVVLPDGSALGANGLFATIDDSEDDDLIYRVGYVGNKRYVRVVATAVDTPGNTPIAISLVGEPLLTDVNS